MSGGKEALKNKQTNVLQKEPFFSFSLTLVYRSRCAILYFSLVVFQYVNLCYLNFPTSTKQITIRERKIDVYGKPLIANGKLQIVF